MRRRWGGRGALLRLGMNFEGGGMMGRYGCFWTARNDIPPNGPLYSYADIQDVVSTVLFENACERQIILDRCTTTLPSINAPAAISKQTKQYHDPITHVGFLYLLPFPLLTLPLPLFHLPSRC